MLKVRSSQDLLAGILFIAFGAAFLFGAADLAKGTALRMGPGYVPRILSTIILFVGAVLVLKGLTIDGAKTGYWGLRPLICVVAATLAFAFGIQRLGLVPTIMLTIGISAFAMDEIKPLELTVLAIVMAFGSTLLFVYGLKLNFPIWPQL